MTDSPTTGTPDPDGPPRTYPAGVTSWIDVEHPDVEAALAFYGALFGWTFTDAIPEGAPVRYVIAQQGGLDAAAIAGPAEVGGEVSGPPGWQTYVAVDDAEAAAAAVSAAGGRVVQPPTSAGDGGTSVVCEDPDGTPFRLWQADRRLGAQVTNAPGAWNFSNLRTEHPEVAHDFYAPVFGWELDVQDWATAIRVPGYGRHLADTVDPGIFERQQGAPDGFADVIGAVASPREGERPHWDVVFSVADRDATTALAEELGGVVLGRADEQWSRDAVVRDPQGAVFTVSEFAPPEGTFGT